MMIDVSKFGTVLLSHPAGHEAFLAARAYTIPKDGLEKIEVDFTSVKVLTPSWADEFLSGLEQEYGRDRIEIVEGGNLSVKMTLATLRQTSTIS